MKIYQAPVVLWQDVHKNWYGRHLEPFSFLPDELRYFCDTDKSSLLSHMKTSLKKVLDAYQKENGSLTPVPDREFSWTNVSFKVRPTQVYAAGRFPESRYVEIVSPLIWRTDPSGVTFAALPVEGVEFSAFKHESYLEMACEALRRWYADRSQREILLRSKIDTVQIETLTISLERIRENQPQTKPAVGAALTRLALPIDRTLRRQYFIRSFGRESESENLAQKLRSRSTNLILCGPAGCGKSTLLIDAALTAQKYLEEQDSIGKTPLFWWSNVRHLTAGTRWLGEWQNQLANLFSDLAQLDAVLCLEDIAELLNDTQSPHESIAALLIPYLEEGRIHLAGETTPETLRTLGRTLPAFVERFEVIKVEPMNEWSAASAMQEYAKNFVAGRHHFTVDPDAPQVVAKLYRRFFAGCSFPGPAFSFFRKSLQTAYRKKTALYGQENVYADFLSETGLPERLFRDEQTLSRSEVGDALRRAVVGQPEAIDAATGAVLRFKTALNHPKKPIASFLFCGPTGVGKTQLVRTLAEHLFGSQKTEDRHNTSKAAARKLLRLDMSEYQFFGSAERLIELGNGKSGPLIEHIRREPFSIILFDEIEKAASDVFDLLLNLLDEGRLTDRIGRTFDFRNTILVMTSNLGTSGKRSSGFAETDSDAETIENCRKAVRDFFRPEFFNRIDELVVFHALDRTACRAIAAMEVKSLEKREGIAARQLRLEATDALLDRLLRDGFHPAYGARPLRREVEKMLVPPLARFLRRTTTSDATLQLDVAPSGTSGADTISITAAMLK